MKCAHCFHVLIDSQLDVIVNLSSNPENIFLSWILGTYLPLQVWWVLTLIFCCMLQLLLQLLVGEHKKQDKYRLIFSDLFSHYSAWVLSNLKNSLTKCIKYIPFRLCQGWYQVSGFCICKYFNVLIGWQWVWLFSSSAKCHITLNINIWYLLETFHS